MNPKILHNLTMVPFLIIGLMASILGVAWLATSEPLIGISTLEAVFIPSSPFVYVTILLWILWIISVFAGIGLRKHAG